MSRRNIAAYTETSPQSYPGYASLNQEVDGRIVLTVREQGHNGTKDASVEIPPEELKAFAKQILSMPE